MARVAAFVDRHLSRITSGGRLIPEVDGLRFLAIVPVLLHHLQIFILERSGIAFTPGTFSRFLQDIIRQGKFGVDLFFVLSGFILALPFARAIRGEGPPVRLRRYYVRRLTRIEPPYVVSMLLFFVLLGVVKGVDVARSLLPNLGASLLYLHTILFGTNSRINSVAWSLEVEVQFYVVVPLLAAIFRAPRHARRAVLALGVLFFSLGNAFWFPRIPAILPKYVQYFLAGFFLADIYLERGEGREDGRTAAWDATVLLALGVWYGVLHAAPRAADAMLPLVFGVLVWGAFLGRWMNRLSRNLYVRTIGGMCYTLYLLHYPAISFFGRYMVTLGRTTLYPVYFLGQSVLVMVPVFAVSVLFFVVIERPCMIPDWPAKLLRRFRI